MSVYPVTPKPVAPIAGAATVKPGPSFPKKPQDWPAYLQAVAQEWTKITWPNQLQVVGLTLVVVAITTAITAMLWGIDTALRFAIQFITPAR
jgi:preprotein translocase SecE subunit